MILIFLYALEQIRFIKSYLGVSMKKQGMYNFFC